jgi:hypothetical protein
MFLIKIFYYYYVSNVECKKHECRKHQIGDELYCQSLTCDSFNVENYGETILQCSLNNELCVMLNGICSDNPCHFSTTEGQCVWGCKVDIYGNCVIDECAAHDVRSGYISECVNDENNKCIYTNNRCEVDQCSFYEEIKDCVEDVENKCVYDGISCSRGSCELFLDDLNLCDTNTRCVTISGKCYENPCNEQTCDENLCILPTISSESCNIDPCALHLPTDIDCGSIDGCIVKTSGINRFCVSGDCSILIDNNSCKVNGKCVFMKNRCVNDPCQKISIDECNENVLCYIDTLGSCLFDDCSEGSGLDDGGDMCLSLVGCGYDTYEGICKTSTSQFGEISVGNISGIV